MNVWVTFGVVWAVVFSLIIGLLELKRWSRKWAAVRAQRDAEARTRLRFKKEADVKSQKLSEGDWLLPLK